MKLLLIEPPYYRLYKDTYSLSVYPLALGYLAAVAQRDTDWDVAAYNADFSPRDEPLQVSRLTGAGYDNYLRLLRTPDDPFWRGVQERIREQAPDVVGISAKSQNFASACVVAELVKKINRDITVIMGGPHPTLVGPEALDCEHIDVAVRGEGEQTLLELLGEIQKERKLENVNGVVFRRNGDIVETAPRAYIQDLDALPFPNDSAPRALVDFDKYPPSAFGNIFALRGCPYNCFYCGSRNIWSRKVRFRSPENVLEEIRGVHQLGADVVTFQDDTFGVTKNYIRELCETIIEKMPDLKWQCEIHVKLVEPDTVELLKRAGCRMVFLGVESGNDNILKKIRKGYTIDEAHRAVDMIKKQGIDVYAFFMVGFPWETEDSLNDTIHAMRTIRSDVLVYSIFTPYPKTEAFEYCLEKGLVDERFDVSLYNHQSPANCFIEDMDPEKFRRAMERVEKMVDRKNSRHLLRKNLTPAVFAKIRRLGLAGSVRRLLSLLRATSNR